MELSDALEAGGSYSKAEITERLDKYRDKLLQVSVYVHVCMFVCVCVCACVCVCVVCNHVSL